MAIVFIPSPLHEMTGGLSQIEAGGTTVQEVLNELERRFPGLRQRLCTGDELSAALQVSIDDSISSRGLQAEVGPDSEIHFLPALGGG